MKQRKDGRWQKAVTINGKRVFFYSSEPTERKAVKDIEQQLIQYTQKSKDGILFSEAATEWKIKHFPTIAFNTQVKYENCLKRALAYFGDYHIKDLTALDVERYVKKLVAEGFAKDTVSVNLGTVSRVFEYAEIQGYIDNNICKNIRIPKGLPKSTREAPTKDERSAIINSVDKHFGLFAYMAIMTGLRRAELLALTWDDIDFGANIIKVNKSVVYQHNQPIISPTKTKNSVRDVMMPKALSDVLITKKATGYIFGSKDKPMTYQAFRRAYERYQRESGVKLTAHQLRHGYATLLYEANIDAKSAQALLGHANISTTLDIYTHISASKMQLEKEKLDSFLADVN